MLLEILIGFFLLIAAIIDIKTREVPNFLSYGLLVMVSFNIIYLSLINHSWDILLTSVYGLVIAGLFGYLLYRAGQWGGGDVKLIFSMGIYYGFVFNNLPNLLIYIILMFLSGGIIGIIYSFFMAIKHWKQFKKKVLITLKIQKIHNTRKILTSSIFLMILISLILQNKIIYSLLGIFFMVWLGFYLWLIVKSVEEITMIKTREISKLVEGDWLVKTVSYNGLTVKPREIGMTKKDLIKIRKMGLKKIQIKEGLPFVPSFFIAYTLMFFSVSWIPF